MTIPLQRGKSVRVSPSSCSQLLIRPSPRSGLGRALSGIHNDYDYGVDYEDELSEKVEVPEGFGLMGIVMIKRSFFQQGIICNLDF